MPEYPVGAHPLAETCEQWRAKIKAAQKRKEEEFGKYARECSKFFDGNHNFMWDEAYRKAGESGSGGFLGEGAILPTFQMSVNRLFEAVAIFGPVLYNREPHILVTPRNPPLVAPEALGIFPGNQMGEQAYQQLQMQHQAQSAVRGALAALFEHLLNWLQVEAQKKVEARLAITEAIVKGASTLWIEMYSPPGSRIRYPKSFYDSIDNLVVDPDAERWEDVLWVARQCVHPRWKVGEEYGIQEEEIKGHYESFNSQGDTYGSEREKATRKKYENTFDLVHYWKIYSKAGFGSRLKKTAENTPYTPVNTDMLGQFCYLAVADGIPFPLNLPSRMVYEEEFDQIKKRVEWPIPFYMDGGWPFARLHFYDKPNCVWPIPLAKPAIGELRFVNWCMSFLADKVAASSKTLVGVLKHASESIREQLSEQHGPYQFIELTQTMGQRIADLVSFLDAPDFSNNLWTMVREALELIDKRMGLTELAYGMSSASLRSATEANIKDANISVRPDDMANQVEDFISVSAQKELQAARWMLRKEDVLPVLGELGAEVWANQVMVSDVDSVVRDFDQRVEAGTARKPNKSQRMQALTDLGNVILPTIQQFAINGQPGPWNAYVEDAGKAFDMDASRYLIPPPDPSQQGPSPEEIKAQAEQQKLQMEMERDQQKAQTDLAIAQQKAQIDQQKAQADLAIKREELEFKRQELELKRQELQMKMAFEREKLQVEQVSQQQEMANDQARMEQERLASQQQMAMEQEATQQKISAEKEMAQHKVDSARQQSDVKLETQKAQSKAQIETTKQTAKAQADAAKAKSQAAKKQSKQKPKGDSK